MIFDSPYIKHPELTGNTKDDAVDLLHENGKEKTAIHCVKVAETCAELAGMLSLTERSRINPVFYTIYRQLLTRSIC